MFYCLILSQCQICCTKNQELLVPVKIALRNFSNLLQCKFLIWTNLEVSNKSDSLILLLVSLCCFFATHAFILNAFVIMATFQMYEMKLEQPRSTLKHVHSCLSYCQEIQLVRYQCLQTREDTKYMKSVFVAPITANITWFFSSYCMLLVFVSAIATHICWQSTGCDMNTNTMA